MVITADDLYQAIHHAGPDGLAMADVNQFHKTDPDRPRVLPTERAAAGRHLRLLLDATAIEVVRKGRWRAVGGPDWTSGDPTPQRATQPVPQAHHVLPPDDATAGHPPRPSAPPVGTLTVDATLLAYADPDERRALALYLVQNTDDWRAWIPALFPQFASRPFAPHHEDFWEHVWSIEAEKRPPPYVIVWARGAAKSASMEMAVVALAARQRRRYAWYCHETGTEILDPDLGWTTVDDHPTAVPRVDDGFQIKVAGLPWNLAEVVTPEHRYWTRRIAARPTSIKDGNGYTQYRTEAGWTEARMIDWNTWIGLPIDTTVVDHEIELTEKINRRTSTYAPGPLGHRSWLTDPEWWWVIGLWWGDGTLGGARNSQISWAMADAHPEYLERLLGILRRHGYDPKTVHPKSGAALCHIVIADTAFANWLYTWKRGRSRKEPPTWVEHLPLNKQRELLRGYLAADGNRSNRGASLSSIHLTGLLAVRRIGLRLGIVSTICQARQSRDAGGFVSPTTGEPYPTSAAYRLDMRQGVACLGYDEAPMTQTMLDLFIEDGCFWSRVKTIERVADRKFVAVTTSTGEYLTHVGRSHNCSSRQQQADDHLTSIGAMLQGSTLAAAYPALADRRVDKFGHSQGWRRNRLWTADGFVADALGLDVAVRGVRVEEQRPDLILLDDIDLASDTPAVIEKKIRAITRDILPAGTTDVAVLAGQNLIHAESIFAQLASTGQPGQPEPATFLADRIVAGPIPAVYDLEVEHRISGDGRTRCVITNGTPSWPARGIDPEQDLIDTIGLPAYAAECQHEDPDLRGGWFDHLDFTDSGPIRIAEVLLPDLVRTVAVVDPAVTSTDKSDSCGIIIMSLTRDRRFAVQWAWERIASPADAMRVAITAAIEYGAEAVVVETDQGGDTWKLAYETVRKAVVDEMISDNGDEIPDGLFLPRFEQAKAGSTGMSKRERIAKLRVDYDVGPRIIHVGAGAYVLERGLRRFPLYKPYDVVDAAWWARHWLGSKGRGDLRAGGKVKTRAAKGVLPQFSPSSLPGARG